MSVPLATDGSIQRVVREVNGRSSREHDLSRSHRGVAGSESGCDKMEETIAGTTKRNARLLSTSQNLEASMESVEDYIPTPPNGGYGWVIVCASLVGNLLVDGLSYSFGVFLLEFVDAYKETKSKVSLVGSLLSGVYLFVGPIVSALTNKYGCRPVVIAGSIIATSGFVLATVSPSINVLIVTYGVIGGFGLGMIYLPSIVSVGYYFDTKRAFATGLAVCGSGLGTFIFPPLSEFLLTEFSWQGGLLIIAGIMFQGCVCGTLMRPLEAKPRVVTSKEKTEARSVLDRLKESTHSSNRSISESYAATYSGGGSRKMLEQRVTEAKAEREKHLQETDMGSLPVRDNSRLNDKHSEQKSSDPDSNLQERLDHLETTDELEAVSVLSQVTPRQDLTEAGDRQQIFVHTLDNGASRTMISEFLPLLEVSASVIHPRGIQPGSQTSVHISREDLARPLYRKDIFYSGSVLNIPQFHSQPDMKSYITSITVIPAEEDGAQPRILSKFCSCLPRPVQDVLLEMLDVSLFKDIGFMLICLGNFTAFLGMYVPFVFLVDRTASMGYERSEAAFLISVIGIANTAGRIVIGKVADLHIVDSLVITYVSIALSGLATGLVPFCNTYTILAVDAAVFGLGMAAYIALSSIIICDRLGVEKLTNGFGLLTLVRGSAAIVGPPLAGFMFDSSGSYDLSFFIGGLLLLAGAACLVLLHLPALRHSPGHMVEEIDGI